MITHLSNVRQSPFPRRFLRHSRRITARTINAINNNAPREAAAINAVKIFLSSSNIHVCLLGTIGSVVESVKTTTTTTTEINDLNDVTGGSTIQEKRDRFGHGPSCERAPSSSE